MRSAAPGNCDHGAPEGDRLGVQQRPAADQALAADQANLDGQAIGLLGEHGRHGLGREVDVLGRLARRVQDLAADQPDGTQQWPHAVEGLRRQAAEKPVADGRHGGGVHCH